MPDCNGKCLMASDLGGDPRDEWVVHEHPDCPEHGGRESLKSLDWEELGWTFGDLWGTRKTEDSDGGM